jgi:ribosomal protein S28E/S33
LKLKSKVLAGASALAMAGGLIGVAAPAAHAAVVLTPTVITPGGFHSGECVNTVQLVKLTTPVKGVGLGDQTRDAVKAAGNVAKDQTSKLAVNGGGQCSGVTPHGDKHIPFPGSGSQGESNLTAKSAAVSITGNASCAQDAPASPGPPTFDVENDATAANAFPLSGKITWTFNETYVDLISLLVKPYKMQAMVEVLGFTGTVGDVIDVGGIVLSGVNAGAIVSGSVWFDPVAKTGGASGYNTGYEIDLGSAVGCQDDLTAGPDPNVNNANIGTVLSGGGPATLSLLGSSTAGLQFDMGEP